MSEVGERIYGSVRMMQEGYDSIDHRKMETHSFRVDRSGPE